MLVKLSDVVEQLQVYPDRMAENLALTKGLYFSQSILLALTSAGAERKNAYEAVQRAAMKPGKARGHSAITQNANRKSAPVFHQKKSIISVRSTFTSNTSMRLSRRLGWSNRRR